MYLRLLVLLIALTIPMAAHAHKALFFAYVENGSVICEGGFHGGKACRECPVTVYDAAAGTELLKVTSDNRGIATFPLTEELKKARFGLKLVLSGGEGHQAEWLLDPEEYLEVVPQKKKAEPSSESLASDQQVAATERSSGEANFQGLERVIETALTERIEPMLEKKLEAKLGPIRRQLAKAEDEGPSFSNILGGIGWFIGIAGLLAWFRSRRY